MNRCRSLVPVLTIGFAAAWLLAACGGPKRPPVVSTTAGDQASGSGRRPARPEPLDFGPDVKPVENESAMGEDFAVSDASGEGGPLADIHFDFDRASLTDEGRATLEKHALWLQNHRETKVTVEGHCDERGTVEYNLALGEKRAQAARDYLVSLGVSAARLRTVSYGKERALDPASSEAAWARNRRAHFAVSR